MYGLLLEPKETSCTVDTRTSANKRNALGKRKSVASVSHHETVSESLNCKRKKRLNIESPHACMQCINYSNVCLLVSKYNFSYS